MTKIWNAILAWFCAEERLLGNKLVKLKTNAQADFDHAIDEAHAELESAENYLHGLAADELAKIETLVEASKRRLVALEQAGVIAEVELHDRLAALIQKVL